MTISLSISSRHMLLAPEVLVLRRLPSRARQTHEPLHSPPRSRAHTRDSSAAQVAACARVCRAWADLARDQTLWFHLFLKFYPKQASLFNLTHATLCTQSAFHCHLYYYTFRTLAIDFGYHSIKALSILMMQSSDECDLHLNMSKRLSLNHCNAFIFFHSISKMFKLCLIIFPLLILPITHLLRRFRRSRILSFCPSSEAHSDISIVSSFLRSLIGHF